MISHRRPRELGALDPRAVSGSWWVARSTLPLWRRRAQPSVTYAPLPGGAVLDAVRFTQRGRETLILGLDIPDPHEPGAFVWRGLSPLTQLARSRWRFVAHDPDCARWAVTVFARTAFTPAGLDVYTRNPEADPELLDRVREVVAGDAEVDALWPRLFTLAGPDRRN